MLYQTLATLIYLGDTHAFVLHSFSKIEEIVKEGSGQREKSEKAVGISSSWQDSLPVPVLLVLRPLHGQ